MLNGTLKNIITQSFSNATYVACYDIDGRLSKTSTTYSNLYSMETKITNLQSDLEDHIHDCLKIGSMKLQLQTDGNLVLYETSTGSDVVVWSALYGLS